MERFKLEKSQDLPGWWVLTDTENLIVLRFEEHNYNDNQKVSVLNDDVIKKLGVQELSRALREMGDFMVRYHGDIAFPQPYGWKYSRDDELLLYRNKFPKFEIHLYDRCDKNDLVKSLHKAIEWLTKAQI